MQTSQAESPASVKAKRIELESRPGTDMEAIGKELKQLQASCKHPHATFERRVQGFEHHCPTCDFRWMSN